MQFLKIINFTQLTNMDILEMSHGN